MKMTTEQIKELLVSAVEEACEKVDEDIDRACNLERDVYDDADRAAMKQRRQQYSAFLEDPSQFFKFLV